MSTDQPGLRIDAARFDAVLFDLDGVLAPTATLHASCWKQAFDALLAGLQAQGAGPQPPFDAEQDYRRYVDGRPRQDGARAFLTARGLEVPEGCAGDPPGAATVQGIARRKDECVEATIAAGGIEPLPGARETLEALRRSGLRTAVVSSSLHCAQVLAACGLQDLFDARIDGQEIGSGRLRGKPEPDTFLEACRRLGVPAARAVIVEDSAAGIRAGRSGGFGLVVGIAVPPEDRALAASGADVVLPGVDALRPTRVGICAATTGGRRSR